MSRKEYFAYGSNLNFDQMVYRCPEATAVGIAKLNGYELAFRRGYLTILPKEDASVEGLIWSITDHDESQLDCYEGYPTFYDKETVTVMDADGTPHEIMVYTMNAPYRDQLLPVSSRYHAVVIAMTGARGLEAAIQAKQLAPETPLVWWSDDKNFALIAYQLRISAFLPADCSDQELYEAIKPIMKWRCENANCAVQL